MILFFISFRFLLLFSFHSYNFLSYELPPPYDDTGSTSADVKCYTCFERLSMNYPECRDWRRIVTSAAKHEFTMRHLLKRRFGSSNEAVRDCLTGESSFSDCILRNFGRDPLLSNIKCVPSKNRIEPGKQGYYNGGWIVRSHAELAMVDSVQIELPMTVR